MTQKVEIANHCPHEITIMAGDRHFSPWGKRFHLLNLSSGGSVSATDSFCSLFSCKSKPLPEFRFYESDSRDPLPYRKDKPRNVQPWYDRITVCPKDGQTAD